MASTIEPRFSINRKTDFKVDDNEKANQEKVIPKTKESNSVKTEPNISVSPNEHSK